MQQFLVEARVREGRGKSAVRRIRAKGEIPAVLYGGKDEPLAVSINAKRLASILRAQAGHNTILTVQVAGHADAQAILKDWQVDPVRGTLLHVDLLRVAMDARMRVKVPVRPYGEPQGVKLQGGIFEIVTREVEIECLPGDIPDEFRVDVSHLMIGKQLRAADLPYDPQKVRLADDPQRIIAHVVALRKEEEAPAPEAAVVEAAAPAEPEVIKKGKKEAEEAPEEEAEK